MLFDATVSGRTERVEVREKDGRYRVTIGDRTLELDVLKAGESERSILIDGASYDLAVERGTDGVGVILRGDRFDVELKDAVKGVAAGRSAPAGPLRLTAPMPGKIVKVLVSPGDSVEAGRGLVVMEAMKMENELKATRGGTVQEIKVKEGQAVETGALLAIIG